MLSLSASVRVFLYTKPVHMQQSFDGLEALIQEMFDEPLTGGAFFAFFNKKKDRMKVLYWDGDGFAIWYKHLQRGSSRTALLNTQIDRREFLMMLEGVEPKRMQKRFKI